MIAGWAVLDQFIIQKGLGHFEWDDLINKLIGYGEPDGSFGAMPRGGDIGGAHMTGVEADAMWEAIYQGPAGGLTQQDADIIFSGPNGPYGEQAFIAAKERAVQLGAKTINDAIGITNQKMMGKEQEKIAAGKPPKVASMPIPEAFVLQHGRYELTDEWRNGVAGKMDKNQPFQTTNDLTGEYALRTMNRDQHNKSPESWARPYHEGLKELRGGGSTREYIESHRLHPNSVYIDNEGHKAIMDLMDTYAANGTPLTTPEAFKAAWVQDATLRNKMPHFGSAPIDVGGGQLQQVVNPHLYGIRGREARESHPQVADADPAEQMVDAQQQPTNYMDSFNPEIFQMKSGKNMLEGRQLDNAFGTYGRQLRRQFIAHHKLNEEGVPTFEELVMGQHGKKRNLMEGLHNALSGQPQPQIPPQPQPQPQTQPVVSPPPEPVAQRPPPAPQQPVIPVPQAQPAPPVPQAHQPPPIPIRQPPPDLNANQAQRLPPQQAGVAMPPQGRGIMDRIGEALGSGAAGIANLFTRQEIENALHTVQIDLALQNDTITKMIPHIPMDNHSIADISFMAGQVKRPASDVVTILNSRGDWREMSKSMDIPLEVIQLVKVAFR